MLRALTLYWRKCKSALADFNNAALNLKTGAKTMNIISKGSLIGLGAAALLAMTACADTGSPLDKADGNALAVQKISKASYAIGELFEMEGKGFVGEDEGRNFVRFKGRFLSDNAGPLEEVNLEVPVEISAEEDDGSQTVAWTRFGPFLHPFSQGGVTGRFKGTIQPIVERNDGVILRGSETSTEFAIDPSIEFTEVQPQGADCGIPALSGFAGLPYRIGVRAMGFTPTEFRFFITSLQEGRTLEEPLTFAVAATGPEAAIGDNEDIVFQEVPADLKYYVAAIRVVAIDAASGGEVEGMLPFNIHRPIEIEYTGNFEVAEYYEPEPVTACIPGAVGNRVTYAETQTQTVQRSARISISNSWTQERGMSDTSNWTEGYQNSQTDATSATRGRVSTRNEGSALSRGETHNESESNNFNQSTTDAENWNTSHNIGGEVNVTVGASGGASIPLVAEGKVSASTSVTGKYGYTTGQGGATTNGRTWGSTNNRGRSNSMSESYTLNNSTSDSRSFNDSTSRTNSRTYSFGGTATVSERISEGQSEAEDRTWSDSSSSSTLTSFSGFIPVGKFGVFYRQTIRLVRVAQIISYNACGERELMGEMLLNEWKWAPDLAVADNCDAKLPDSNLPPAQCIVPPCE